MILTELVSLEKIARLVDRNLFNLLTSMRLGSGCIDEALLVDRFRFLKAMEAWVMAATFTRSRAA